MLDPPVDSNGSLDEQWRRRCPPIGPLSYLISREATFRGGARGSPPSTSPPAVSL
jgi:hypothetical protein